ncbi:MAG: hypothetical protein ABL967_15825 [Bryobacteraceae bacterium]
MDDKLQSLWTEYREACPDPDASPDFMPEMWRRIDARRQSATSWFRRWAEVCVVAAITAALVMSTVVIPSYLRQPVYEASYVDVLNAAETSADGMAVLVGDIE